jgi:membrane-associated phospholipid phosphatase
MNDRTIIKLIVGLLFIQVGVKILKRIIKQNRPIQPKDSDYGMPSTRAASVFFIAVYLILVLPKLQTITKYLLILFAISSSFMKYYLMEHSFIQLLAGASIGIVTSFVFYNI